MRSSKKDKLEAIKAMFLKRKVLKITDLFKALESKSRMTIHRYLKEMDYLTSYSHKGQYYTLQEIAQFDVHGLWHYGDIGFSKHGTLFDTIAYFVNCSDAGMTSSELQLKSHAVVKYALLDLVEKNKLSRTKSAQAYVYISPDQDKAKEQMKKREKMTVELSVDDTTAFRVLLTAYRLIEGAISPEQVVESLKKEGSKISLEVVQQVFRRYDLGKKTLGSSSYQS